MKNQNEKNTNIIATSEGKISRRSMIRQTLFASGGLLMASQTAFPAILARRSIVEVEFAEMAALGRKNFFAQIFNFRNRFWKGFGAIAWALTKRALGLEGINFGPTYNQDVRSIQDYAQNQQPNGWNIPPGSEIYQLPQTGLSCGFANSSDLNFRDVQSRNGSMVAMNPAVLIALTQFAEALRCTCPDFSNTDLANWIIPRQLRAESSPLRQLNEDYVGQFYSKNGLVQVTQNRTPSPYSSSLAELMVEVRNPWKSDDIIWKTKNPMPVNYGD